jgi:hypothetical protein
METGLIRTIQAKGSRNGHTIETSTSLQTDMTIEKCISCLKNGHKTEAGEQTGCKTYAPVFGDLNGPEGIEVSSAGPPFDIDTMRSVRADLAEFLSSGGTAPEEQAVMAGPDNDDIRIDAMSHPSHIFR